MLATTAPFPQYFDSDGSPLDGGTIYFGQPNQNPETAPISVYWDAAGTQPASQPIQTMNGYAVRNGTPALVYAGSDYSITVRSKRGRLIYYAQSAESFSNAFLLQSSAGAGNVGFNYGNVYPAGSVGKWLQDLALAAGSTFVGWIQAGAGAVLRTISSKLRETVSVLDFGAVADGNIGSGSGTDNTAAFQAAIDYAQANSLAVFVPAGIYVVKNQLLVGSNVRIYGAGMYRTYLIAPNTFTADGLLWAQGAGGPPTIIEHMAILGATGTGAGAGSTGVRASANATLLRHLWVGGFAVQFKLDGTDQHATDCWADVSLAAGYGFYIANGSIHLLDCVTFNCYTGIYIDGTGAWSGVEPDIGVTVSKCQVIQSGYSGITMVGAINTSISGCKIHSPTASSKFTRDFITITDGSNITIADTHCTFGNAVSSSTIGFRQTGQSFNLTITGCSVIGALYGVAIDNAPFLKLTNNTARACKQWGFRVAADSVGALISGNSAPFNGTTNATDGGGFWLTNTANSGKWVVSGNSVADFGTTSKYGFYLDANASTSAKILLSGNAVTNTTTAYTIVGTPSNVTNVNNI